MELFFAALNNSSQREPSALSSHYHQKGAKTKKSSITIHNPTLGYVTVLPIGICLVSSVVPGAQPGENVKKGITEISHFEFGGSDCVVVFEPTANVTVFGAVDPVTGHGQKYLVGEVLGYANPLS